MNTDLRNVPFSPPDMTEAEAKEVREAILSGWITTGPRTKKLEQQISAFVHTDKTVCLNSATCIYLYSNSFCYPTCGLQTCDGGFAEGLCGDGL